MARTDPPNGLGHKGLILLPILLALWGLGGCATAYVRGQAALRQERYDEAASYFIEALATDPGRLDARTGLGITRYKQGKFDEAEDALQQVITQVPGRSEARLYLGLTYLQKGENSSAEEQLTALLALKPHRRIAAQIERALRLIRSGPLSDDTKIFVAASLEDEAEWECEIREAERERCIYVEPLWPVYWHSYWYPYWYRYRF